MSHDIKNSNMELFEDTNIGELKEYVIFLDIDGTIASDSDNEVTEKTLEQIAKLKNDNHLYLCSNSRNHERNRQVADIVKAEYIDTDLKKPSKKILNVVDHDSFQKRLVIGDKFLTDGLFAKNIKAEFIKVKRISSDKDRAYIKLLYWIDDIIWKIAKWKKP